MSIQSVRGCQTHPFAQKETNHQGGITLSNVLVDIVVGETRQTLVFEGKYDFGGIFPDT
jgi:hypothetical protein